VRREGRSVAFRRVTRVEGEPQVGSWRRLSSGTMKRGWDFAHLRGFGRGALGRALGVDAVEVEGLRLGGIVRLGDGS
jgi:hypothetical protein